ncbi:3-hydroxy-acyl-CoA-dehydrogenase [Mycena galopus ATCC 62051]|nr:3-hydroxy-acyl-CoA-dehydrogenase [Mycena galopus ATCC 62051]
MKKEFRKVFISSDRSSGLGLATVHDLISADAYVSIVDRSPPPTDLPTSKVKYFETDITKVEQIELAVDATVKWTVTTNAPLGGVINCAGVGTAAKIIDAHNEPHSLDLWDFTLAVNLTESWQRHVDINLTGAFNLTRLVLKHLIRVPPEDGDGERGVVILVSSVAAQLKARSSDHTPNGTRLARFGVRVVTIAPGPFVTPLTGQWIPKVQNGVTQNGLLFPRRYGAPSEFAEAVRFVVSCAYINGETIKLTGGGRLPARL